MGDIYDLLSNFSLIEHKKIGYFYKDVILIQESLVFKLQKSKELSQVKGLYFSYQYQIPIIADAIGISSNHNIIRTEISSKGYDDITLTYGNNTIKGKIKKHEYQGKYSIITLIDDKNNEITLKLKEHVITRDINTNKTIDITLLLPKKLVNNNLTLGISYKLNIEQCSMNNNNDYWFFHHYITLDSQSMPEKYETPIYETDNKLDNLTLTTKIFIKPLCMGEKTVKFNKINFIDRFINIPQRRHRSNERGEMLEEAVPLASTQPIQKEEKITNISETIEGDIILASNMENAYLILSDNKLKGRLINIIDIDMSYIQDEYPLKPMTKLVFLTDYFNQNVDTVFKNTIPPIPSGKLTIYGQDNEEYLTNDNDLILTSQTDIIDLGESNTLNLSYKILKNENIYKSNSVIKIIQFKITNIAHVKTRLTIRFNHVDFIIVLYQKHFDINQSNKEEEEFDINTVGNIIKEEDKLIFKSKEQNTCLLDFILDPSSDTYTVLYIRLK